MKLLIADDDANIRTLLGQVFEKLEEDRVEILFASNGLEALTKIQTELPELVFLDIIMPQMDGFTVCKKVRELNLTNITIVILTAKGQQIDKAQSQASGADLFMNKPFDPDEVLRIAREILYK